MAEAMGGEWNLSRGGGQEQEEVLRAEYVPLPLWGRLARGTSLRLYSLGYLCPL